MSINFLNFNTAKIYYREDSVDEDVLKHSFERDIFYKGIPEYKTKGGIIVDIGAHIGSFSIYSVLSKNALKVYAFEPNKESYQLLLRNITENNLTENIKPLNIALSNSKGTVKLYLDEENWGHSITYKELEKYEEVTAITFQNFLDSERINFCDLVKFNCEGAEFQIVLSLNEEQLSKIGMMLILFHEDLVVNSYSRKNIISFLSKKNFLIRLSHITEKRGWIIAKNKNHYGNIPHFFFSFGEYLDEHFKYFWNSSKQIVKAVIKKVL